MARMKDLMNVYKVLDTYGQSAVREMITRLKSANKVSTGKLLRSINYKIVQNKEALELYFEMLDYGEIVDLGRKVGTFPPMKAIIAWCKKKGIDKSAAYPIARSIKENGIKPTYFYTLSTRRRAKQFSKQLALAYKLDVKKMLEKELKKK